MMVIKIFSVCFQLRGGINDFTENQVYKKKAGAHADGYKDKLKSNLWRRRGFYWGYKNSLWEYSQLLG